MTSDSYFIRVGSSYERMDDYLINKIFRERTKNSLKYIISPRQDLTFTDLKNIPKGIIGLMLDRPKITQDEMSNLLGVTLRTIRNHIKYLIDNDYIGKEVN